LLLQNFDASEKQKFPMDEVKQKRSAAGNAIKGAGLAFQGMQTLLQFLKYYTSYNLKLYQ
jgi:hypothetical protein